MSKSHDKKILWMTKWCKKAGLKLELSGECGFGRECVGVLSSWGNYPDYEWYDDNYDRQDSNGDVWVPADAYHKHPCVAVLGRGEEAEAQLYDWLKWFDENGFVFESGDQALPGDPTLNMIHIMLGKHKFARMVRKQVPALAAASAIAKATGGEP